MKCYVCETEYPRLSDFVGTWLKGPDAPKGPVFVCYRCRAGGKDEMAETLANRKSRGLPPPRLNDIAASRNAMPKKKETSTGSEIQFDDVISIGAIPGRGSSHKYDVVVERAAGLAKGEALPFQAPSTSSLTRLKKRLAEMGYALTTRTNAEDAPVNPGGVTAFVMNVAGPPASK